MMACMMLREGVQKYQELYGLLQKHVLHVVWSAFVISRAISTALKVVLYPKEKLGVNFYIPKKTIPGVGGSEGRMVKDYKFPDFFPAPFPNILVRFGELEARGRLAGSGGSEM